MTVTEALRIAARLAEAAAEAIEAGEDQLPADTFSAPAHEALANLEAALKASGG